MLLSAEFHPFRLPVPDLWLDVFEKIKAMGFTGVSFYIDWALLEGTPGIIVKDGIFSLEKFFAAAQQAGIYLIARPGPFINAEASGEAIPAGSSGSRVCCGRPRQTTSMPLVCILRQLATSSRTRRFRTVL